MTIALPKATWNDFNYAGGFRLPEGKIDGAVSGGEIKQNRGAIGMGTTSDKMFIQGLVNSKYAWCEMNIPELNVETTFDKMNKATLSQDFAEIEANADDRGEHPKNRYMYCYVHKGQLIGHAVHNYDSHGKDKYMVWKVEDATNLSTSKVSGLFELDCAYLGSGWISEVPDEWKEAFGCNHVIGHAHNFSISHRASIGPTCYGIDLDQITADIVVEPIKTQEFLSYPFAKNKALYKTKYPDMIQSDLNWKDTDLVTYEDAGYNTKRKHDDVNWPNGPNAVSYPDQNPPLGNDIQPKLSRGAFGFIIPGTSTYAVFGQMFGHTYGSGYRINNDESVNNPKFIPPKPAHYSGPAPYVHKDRDSCLWFYDVNDLLDVKNGLKKPWDIIPYEYHVINYPNQNTKLYDRGNDVGNVFGGTYDKEKNRLYLGVRGYDNSKPLILAYDIDIDLVVKPPIDQSNVTLNELREQLNKIEENTDTILNIITD